MPHAALPPPAVDLTIQVRYPLPDLDEDYSAFGIHTPADLVREQVESFLADPAELVDLIESGRSQVEIEFEIDAAGHEFDGGAVPAEFHGRGEE